MSAPTSMNQQQFAAAQLADQARLPWAWDTRGKTSTPYAPVISGKWWSQSAADLVRMASDVRRNWSHIGRIMETELGEELTGDDRCQYCRSDGQALLGGTSQAGLPARNFLYALPGCAACGWLLDLEAPPAS
ncbi:hypothetical protein BP6252_04724 [Coleophoma cylindrospora]|uniref:Uncharacterized protein n=1 Tax=Coleophoma cylindrospora TaxID=1849047 RepID=A0A3D8S1F3_9HELO|nr:hypothetical protein BP6252_04724 [Coleophoma cylindrospora]